MHASAKYRAQAGPEAHEGNGEVERKCPVRSPGDGLAAFSLLYRSIKLSLVRSTLDALRYFIQVMPK